MIGSRRTRLALLCLVGVCLLGGCTSILSDTVTEEELLSEIENTEPPEVMTATVEFNTTLDNETMEYEYDVWYGPDGATRIEGNIDGERFVTVNDGDQIWSYTVGEDTVIVRDAGNSTSANRPAGNATKQLLEERNVTEISETEYLGRDVYHVVFDKDAARTESSRTGLFEPLLPSVGGLVSGDDSQTDERSRNDSFHQGDRIEVWIDAEYMLLLKQNIGGDDGFDMQYTAVEFEPEIDDDRFEFEVPENATVEEIETPDIEMFDSIEGVVDESPIEVDEPSFETLDAEFESGYVQTRNDSAEVTVSLQYDVGQNTPVTVTKRKNATERQPDGERIEIGDVTGTYTENSRGDIHSVVWTANGFQYRVFASLQTDREILIEIAESMETT